MDLTPGRAGDAVAEPLRIWAVSDGRAGIENQALGLAEAVARLRPAEVTVKRIAYRAAWGRLPTLLARRPRALLGPNSDRIEPPWPDLWIAAGRASLPFSLRMRRWSGGRTFVVQTQDPRLPLDAFDLVIPPAHDGLAGEKVFAITGSPGRLTPERLACDRMRFASLIDPLPEPRVAVLIGGRSKAFDLSPARAEAMAGELERGLQAAGGSMMLTFSRRTPEAAKDVLRRRLGGRGPIWDGEGENPYFAFLAAADFAAVTEDSTNMAAEAASTGAPVFVLKMEGGSARMRRFHQDLAARGAARPFQGVFERFDYAPLRETDRAAAEVLRRYDARRER